jgi:hypothetical protein
MAGQELGDEQDDCHPGTLDARWPLLRRLLLETPPATRLHETFYLPGDLP